MGPGPGGPPGGGVGNQPPVIDPQAFSVEENSAVGTAVGTVVASDPDGDALTYAITAGNTDGAFAIDAASGALTVDNQSSHINTSTVIDAVEVARQRNTHGPQPRTQQRQWVAAQTHAHLAIFRHDIVSLGWRSEHRNGFRDTDRGQQRGWRLYAGDIPTGTVAITGQRTQRTRSGQSTHVLAIEAAAL